MNNIIIYVVVGENHTIQTINLGQINKEAIKVNMLLLWLCLNWFQLFSYIDYVSLWIVSATPSFSNKTLSLIHTTHSVCLFVFSHSPPLPNTMDYILLFFFFFFPRIFKRPWIYIYILVVMIKPLLLIHSYLKPLSQFNWSYPS